MMGLRRRELAGVAADRRELRFQRIANVHHHARCEAGGETVQGQEILQPPRDKVGRQAAEIFVPLGQLE